MKKQVLVTVDRGETRVAMLEAAGEVTAARRSRRRKKGGLPTGYRVAEVYFERRGGRSIVGNIYKGKVDNVLPGLEAAFVDIGLDKNGFLHVDEIVLPGVEQVKRGRGTKGSGPSITDLLKPGQEIVVQVIKDPLKTKGARLTMELTIAGRYMVYAPFGEGVGVSRRLEDKERTRLRGEAKQLDLGGGGAIIRTAAHGADARGLRARAAVPVQAQRGAGEAGQGDRGAGHGLPGGRPLHPRRARHLLRPLRARDRRRPEAAPPARLLLRPHGARAGRPRGALGGADRPLRGLRRRARDRGDALAARRPAQRRLPDDRLRRGAHGHRHQHGLLHRQGEGRPARGHDHADEPGGGRGGRQPAAAARHRRHHRHRLHRHGPRAQPRRRAQDAAQGARRGPHEDVRGRDLAARPGRDDAPERDGRRARDHDQDVPDLRRRGRREVGGDDRHRGRAPAQGDRRPGRATRRPRPTWSA